MFSSNGSQVKSDPIYIEDVFNTFPWTGTGGAAGPFVTGIDLLNEGGLLWTKQRQSGYSYNHYLMDTVRGNGSILTTNNTAAAVSSPACVNFYSNGFKDNFSYGGGIDVVSWSFRKQRKFFDIVTWSGNDASNRQIAHNLGSVPGCIIVRAYTGDSDWSVYHRSLGNTKALCLNLTQAQETNTNWGNTTPTSSVFTTNLNGAGNTYIAYLFAHDAGGFGTTGTDNVITCGSFVSDASGGISPVNLGFEPQWLLVKNTSGDGWRIQDVMRGWSQTQLQDLSPNSSAAERVLNNNPSYLSPTATGFSTPTPGIFTPSNTFIYIAIRRGPMKVPTLGTSVYNYAAGTGPMMWTAGWPVDFLMTNQLTGGNNWRQIDRLRGAKNLCSNGTGAEGSETYWHFDNSTGIYWDYPAPFSGWMFARAPSYFDVVCYTGTGVAGLNVAHNLSVVPELMIVKARNNATFWYVYSATLGATKNLYLNGPYSEAVDNTAWNNTAPTSTQFTLGNGSATNTNTGTYVAYLFATCAGVSKVGSYTGNGSTQTINCGFTGGARFVLIKRTDAVGDWYVYDTARGMTTLTDPYLFLNDTAAEVATLGSVTTVATGFALNSSILAAINVNAGTYIFLAIA
jgi:hypothetical protein